MLCDLNNPRRTCPVCGYIAKRLPTYRQCRPVPVPVEQPWRPIMVGDLVEKALTSIGITKDRVERLTRTAGKPGGCGCAQRQKWLNDYGVRVQRQLRKGFESVRRVYGI